MCVFKTGTERNGEEERRLEKVCKGCPGKIGGNELGRGEVRLGGQDQGSTDFLGAVGVNT